MAYDPWGKRRFANGQADSTDSLVGQATHRGYTEHEHLDEVGVIHMNGRVYDPLVGRFMSADPTIPNPFNLQSFNRYSYVRNNPMKLYDPSGFYDEPIDPCEFGGCNTDPPPEAPPVTPPTPPVTPPPATTGGTGSTGSSNSSNNSGASAGGSNGGSVGGANGNAGQSALCTSCPAAGSTANSDITSRASGAVQSTIGPVEVVAGAAVAGTATATRYGLSWVWNQVKEGVVNFFKKDAESDISANLSIQDQRAIRSLEKRIEEHQEKLVDFKNNPTIRPGMENQPQLLIERQWEARINHLEKEIRNWRITIDRLLRGE